MENLCVLYHQINKDIRIMFGDRFNLDRNLNWFNSANLIFVRDGRLMSEIKKLMHDKLPFQLMTNSICYVELR